MSRLRVLVAIIAASLALVSCSPDSHSSQESNDRKNAVKVIGGLVDDKTGLVQAFAGLDQVPADLTQTWQLRQLAYELSLDVPPLDEDAVGQVAGEANGVDRIAAAVLGGSDDVVNQTLAAQAIEALPEADRIGLSAKVVDFDRAQHSVPNDVTDTAKAVLSQARPEVVCGSAYLARLLRAERSDVTNSCRDIGVNKSDSTRRALDLASIQIGQFRALTPEEDSFLESYLVQFESADASEMQAADLEAAYGISQALPHLKRRAVALIAKSLEQRLDSQTGLCKPVIKPSMSIEDTYQAALLLGESIEEVASPELNGTLEKLFEDYAEAGDEVSMQKVIFIKVALGREVDSLVSRYKEVRKKPPAVLTKSDVAEWATILDLNRKIGLEIARPTLELWSPTGDVDTYNAIVSVIYSDLFTNADEIREKYSPAVDAALAAFDEFSGPTESVLVALRASHVAGTASVSRRDEIIEALRTHSDCSWGEPFLTIGYKTGQPADTQCSLKDTVSLRFSGGLSW